MKFLNSYAHIYILDNKNYYSIDKKVVSRSIKKEKVIFIEKIYPHGEEKNVVPILNLVNKKNQNLKTIEYEESCSNYHSFMIGSKCDLIIDVDEYENFMEKSFIFNTCEYTLCLYEIKTNNGFKFVEYQKSDKFLDNLILLKYSKYDFVCIGHDNNLIIGDYEGRQLEEWKYFEKKHICKSISLSKFEIYIEPSLINHKAYLQIFELENDKICIFHYYCIYIMDMNKEELLYKHNETYDKKLINYVFTINKHQYACLCNFNDYSWTGTLSKEYYLLLSQTYGQLKYMTDVNFNFE